MPTIKGNLMFVSSRAAQVSEVWVRAPKVRTYVEGVVTTGNDRFPVDGGEVSFTVVPGPAVLALISQGRAVDTIPILVGDASTQTLRQVVSAAKVADDATQREIEKLAAQAVELVDSSVSNAQKAQDGATRAETAAGNAKQSETNAASSAEGAKTSASSASSSASKAATSEKNAAKSASAAATSASQASGSASSAKSDADRAGSIADSTSWDGDKLTVNGKTSPSLRGPKGAPGPQGDPGPKGTVEPGEVVPLPRGRMMPGAASGVNATWDVTWNGGVAVLTIQSLTVTQSGAYGMAGGDPDIPEDICPGTVIYGNVFADSGRSVGKVNVTQAGQITWVGLEANKEYNGVIVWPIGSDVSAMSGPAGPMGPPGEVTKQQLDTAVAAEKARTVGMVWMVETETAAQAKETSCQKGDFIQVAATGNIYQVTNAGLKLVSTPTNTAGFVTQTSSGSWANWTGKTPAWAEIGDGFLRLTPGRYRVECPSKIVPYTMDPFQSMTSVEKDGIVEADRTMQIYCYSRADSIGTIFVTRLA